MGFLLRVFRNVRAIIVRRIEVADAILRLGRVVQKRLAVFEKIDQIVSGNTEGQPVERRGTGTDDAHDFAAVVDQRPAGVAGNAPDAEPEKGYFYRSDHISLAKKGVPMLYADSGIDFREGGEEAGRKFSKDYVENRYHTPADEYDESWDLTGMLDTVEVLYETGAAIAYSDDWPNWYDGNEFRALRDAQRAGD